MRSQALSGPVGATIKVAVDDGAWYAEDLESSSEWVRHFGDAELAEFESALEASRHLVLVDISADSLLLPKLGSVLREVRETLEHGKGLFPLRGLRVGEQFSANGANRTLWAICRYLGAPRKQQTQGELLGSVAFDSSKPRAVGRFNDSNRALAFHSDPAEIVCSLCHRQAARRGEGLAPDWLMMHNDVLLKKEPDPLREVYATLPVDRMNAQPPGAQADHKEPVYKRRLGQVSCRTSPNPVHRSQRLREAPRLTAEQVQALYFIQGAGSRDGVRIWQMLEPGDVRLLNNYVVVHGRTAFEGDPANRSPGRLLARLWPTWADWEHSSSAGNSRISEQTGVAWAGEREIICCGTACAAA